MDEENNSSKNQVKIQVVEASRVEVVMLITCIVFMFALVLFFIFSAPTFDYSNPEFEEIQSSETKLIAELKTFSDEEIADGFPIKINTATKEDLQKIPNIGPVMAQKIIDFRNKRGTIVKISDLLSVDGIGKKTLAILEEYCVVN